MPFPAPTEQFPPRALQPAFDQYRRNEAWYTGDQAMIHDAYPITGDGMARTGTDAKHYHTGSNAARSQSRRRGLLANLFNSHSTSSSEGRSRTRLHVPVWGNIATLSSDMLLSEGCAFRLMDRGTGFAVKGEAQRRADEILNGERTRMALLEAAELTAGLSAVAVTAHWDTATSDAPWMELTACDAVVPEFAGGTLVAVNLFTRHFVLDGGRVIRGEYVHVERHERGAVIHGLLKMNGSQVQAIVPLGSIDDATGLTLGLIAYTPGSRYLGLGAAADAVVLPTGIDRLTVSWWRNRPTKLHRRGGGILPMMGRADLEGPGEQLVDTLDEMWSSWLRDIRIGRARLIVPDTFLEVGGQSDQAASVFGPAFDDAREVLTPLAYTQLSDGDNTIQAQQFPIRAAEHRESVQGLTREITQAAGWSLSSYGDSGEAAATATEVQDRTTLSERTRSRKFLHMQHAIVPIAEALLELDRVHYRGLGLPANARVDVRIPDVSHIDPEKEALRFQYLRGAGVLSIDTSVRQLHDDWDEDEIRAEIRRLMLEQGFADEQDGATVGRTPGDTEQPGEDVEAGDGDTGEPEADAA